VLSRRAIEIMVYRLVYTSKAASELHDGDLRQILRSARANNAPLDISGLLLFHERSFFQVLEGAEERVEALFEKISKDMRHDYVKRLFADEVPKRLFGDWSMAYCALTPEEQGRLVGEGSFFSLFEASDPDDETSARLSAFVVKMAQRMVAASGDAAASKVA